MAVDFKDNAEQKEKIFKEFTKQTSGVQMVKTLLKKNYCSGRDWKEELKNGDKANQLKALEGLLWLCKSIKSQR